MNTVQSRSDTDELLDSFVVLEITPAALIPFQNLVSRSLGALTSIAEFKVGRKYYYYPSDSKFYESSWVNLRILEGWIGERITSSLSWSEQVLHRKYNQESIESNLSDLKKIENEIISTIHIGKSILKANEQHELFVKNRVKQIHEKTLQAFSGLKNLCYSYSLEKHKQLHLAKEEFKNNIFKEIAEALNTSSQNSQQSKEIAVIGTKHPFPLPKTALQYLFNISHEHTEEKVSAYIKANEARLKSNSGKYKPRETGMPLTIAVIAQGRIYMHFKMRIVVGLGGVYKTDKIAYSYTLVFLVAKLSMLLDKKDCFNSRLQIGKNEEKYLSLCTEKKVPNVVKLYDSVWKLEGAKRKHILYEELGMNGSLEDSFERVWNDRAKAEKILLGLIRGVAGLHSLKIVHRDLKPANVFLNENDEALIGDLGLGVEEGEMDRFAGTPIIAPPEIHAEVIDCQFITKNNSTTDIWALGLMMYQLLMKVEDMPWQMKAQNITDLKKNMAKFKDQLFPEPVKNDIWLHACWETLRTDPEQRPTAQTLYDRLKPSKENDEKAKQ